MILTFKWHNFVRQTEQDICFPCGESSLCRNSCVVKITAWKNNNCKILGQFGNYSKKQRTSISIQMFGQASKSGCIVFRLVRSTKWMQQTVQEKPKTGRLVFCFFFLLENEDLDSCLRCIYIPGEKPEFLQYK